MFRKTMEEYEADIRKKLVIDIREKKRLTRKRCPEPFIWTVKRSNSR